MSHLNQLDKSPSTVLTARVFTRLYSNIRFVICLLLLSFLSACSSSSQPSSEASSSGAQNNNTDTPIDVLNQTNVAEPIDPNAVLETASDIESDTQSTTLPSTGQIDQSGIAVTENDLTALLLTSFEIENRQVVPTSGWICEDVFEQNRVYYFYPVGVLDGNRRVVVERTLNANNTFDDLTFFWSTSDTDAMVMSSVTAGDNGALLTTGQQYDVTTIRFTVIDTRKTFSAQSLLRGQLTCAIYSLR